jgi:hypothetical protein
MVIGLEECIYKRRHGTAFGKNNQGTKKKEYNYYRKQPIALPDLEKFPEFDNNGLVGCFFFFHDSPFIAC